MGSENQLHFPTEEEGREYYEAQGIYDIYLEFRDGYWYSILGMNKVDDLVREDE